MENPSQKLQQLHLSYGITQHYLPPNTGERGLPNQRRWYSIYLPWRDKRLSWPWCWFHTKMVYLSAHSHPSD